MRYFHYRRFAKTRRVDTDRIVQPNLSITPSQMAQMVAEGRAVSAMAMSEIQNDSEFIDELPVDRMRGMDIADAWNASLDAQDKLINAHRRAQSDAEYDEQRAAKSTPDPDINTDTNG